MRDRRDVKSRCSPVKHGWSGLPAINFHDERYFPAVSIYTTLTGVSRRGNDAIN